MKTEDRMKIPEIESLGIVHIIIKDTDKQDIIKRINETVPLSSEMCNCERPEFLCYPEDGQCVCGIHKHHVHCVCGKVMQIG